MFPWQADLDEYRVPVKAKPPEERLRCPKSGCQRQKPFENAAGRLECWWCAFQGSWHDFVAVPACDEPGNG